MEVTAKTKFVRLSPSKARDICRKVQGLSVNDALKFTDFSERKAAKLIGKTLKSAIANAEHNAKLSVDSLRVKTAVIDQGSTFKRFWPRARGMVSAISRKTSHITVVLTDDNKSLEPTSEVAQKA